MNEIKDKSIRESILTTDGNIIVSASAGTGKTFMTVERIRYDMLKVDNYQTYAAITFTNKAAKELSDRLGQRQQGFVGTNDKFVINEIIVPFAKDVYPQLKGKNIRADYTDAEKKNNGRELLKRFINDGVVGTYTDAHSNFAFKLALYLLKKSHAACRYLTNRYFRVYVDEYQDSDKDMHAFFMYMNEELKIPLFIVGDTKQSIYEWRGGFPEGFKKLLQSDSYVSFKLLHNFRSNEQIQNYATVFMDEIKENYCKCRVKGEVQGCIYKNEANVIKYIQDWLIDKNNCAFLLYSNKEAMEWAKKLTSLGFVYIPRAPIDKPELENEQVWVAKCIANYFYRKRYSEYSFYDEIPNQEAYDISFIKRNLMKLKKEYDKNGWDANSSLIVENLYKYLLSDYDEDKMKIEIQALKETIEDPQYEKSFNIEFYEKVVATIHSSKGLQYKQVIVNSADYIWNAKISNEELHYVAITRSEDRLLIIFDANDKRAKSYCEILSKRVQELIYDGEQQVVSDIIDMIKV